MLRCLLRIGQVVSVFSKNVYRVYYENLLFHEHMLLCDVPPTGHLQEGHL